MSCRGFLHVAKVAGISGSENHLLLLLPALRARGHDVRLVMLHEDEPGAAELADRLEHDGVPVERLRMRASVDPLVFGRLVRSIRRARPDVVHTHLVHADFHGLPPAASRASRCSSRRSTASTRSAAAAPSPPPTGASPGSPTSTSRSPPASRGTSRRARGSTRPRSRSSTTASSRAPAAPAARRASPRDRRPADPDQGARRAARGASARARRGARAHPRDRRRRSARRASSVRR